MSSPKQSPENDTNKKLLQSLHNLYQLYEKSGTTFRAVINFDSNKKDNQNKEKTKMETIKQFVYKIDSRTEFTDICLKLIKLGYTKIINNNIDIRWAAKCGYIEFVKVFLKEMKNISSNDINVALVTACEKVILK